MDGLSHSAVELDRQRRALVGLTTLSIGSTLRGSANQVDAVIRSWFPLTPGLKKLDQACCLSYLACRPGVTGMRSPPIARYIAWSPDPRLVSSSSSFKIPSHRSLPIPLSFFTQHEVLRPHPARTRVRSGRPPLPPQVLLEATRGHL